MVAWITCIANRQNDFKCAQQDLKIPPSDDRGQKQCRRVNSHIFDPSVEANAWMQDER